MSLFGKVLRYPPGIILFRFAVQHIESFPLPFAGFDAVCSSPDELVQSTATSTANVFGKADLPRGTGRAFLLLRRPSHEDPPRHRPRPSLYRIFTCSISVKIDSRRCLCRRVRHSEQLHSAVTSTSRIKRQKVGALRDMEAESALLSSREEELRHLKPKVGNVDTQITGANMLFCSASMEIHPRSRFSSNTSVVLCFDANQERTGGFLLFFSPRGRYCMQDVRGTRESIAEIPGKMGVDGHRGCAQNCPRPSLFKA